MPELLQVFQTSQGGFTEGQRRDIGSSDGEASSLTRLFFFRRIASVAVVTAGTTIETWVSGLLTDMVNNDCIAVPVDKKNLASKHGHPGHLRIIPKYP